MPTIKQALSKAAAEVKEAVTDSLIETRDRIRSDRSRIEALEEYVQSIYDIEGKYNDQFEAGQQSVAAQVAQIINYTPTYKKEQA